MFAVYSLDLPLLAIPTLLACMILFAARQIVIGTRGFDMEPEEQSLSTDESLMRHIICEMEDSQAFLHKGLTLTDLSQRVGSNRSYVSSCINDNTGLSFSDLVNSYRVKYAQALLQWNADGLSISEIREKSGFSSESTFVRNFKKFAGCTPSEWQAMHSRKEGICAEDAVPALQESTGFH